MNISYRTAFVGGLLGSLAVTGALGLLVLAGTLPKAPFVGAWQSIAGGGWPGAALVGGALFVLIGALWAVPFPAVFSSASIAKGMLWGLLPTLWSWTFVPAVMTGGPLFGGFTATGLATPVVMNCAIWGSIVGWYASRRQAGRRTATRTRAGR